MGSRGWKRSLRVARAQVRAARRAAMVGAANELPANHLDIMRATREVRGHFAGLDGLVPLDLKWPDAISCLHPPLVQGTIGCKPRRMIYTTDPFGHIVGFDHAKIDWKKRQYFLKNAAFEGVFWRDVPPRRLVSVEINLP